jgi:molecular chaperone DnaJ
MRDRWNVLGLDYDATPEELKAAYRRLVKLWHPDRFAQEASKRAQAEARLKLINEAYRVLSRHLARP